MTNPTRQEIIESQLARQWAEKVQQFDAEHERTGRSYSGDPMRAAAEYILSHIPSPTMAEVEWDDDKHYLAEAEHVDWGKVVMLYYDGQSNRIQYFCKLDEPNMVVYSDPANLTPTGKRYTLAEVQEA